MGDIGRTNKVYLGMHVHCERKRERAEVWVGEEALSTHRRSGSSRFAIKVRGNSSAAKKRGAGVLHQKTAP